MADGTALVKVIALLGFVVILTAALSGSTPTEWEIAKSTIEAGIEFPEFWNPFTENRQLITSYASAPFEWGNGTTFPSRSTVVGCTNTTNGRSDCFGAQDADISYIETPCRAEETIPFVCGSISTGIGWTFNYSNPEFREMSGLAIRNIHIEFQCRTLAGDSGPFSFFFTFSTFDNGLGDDGEFAIDVVCPKGNYQTVMQDLDFLNGVVDGSGNPYTLFESTTEGGQAWMSPHNFEDGVNIGHPVLRVTYFRLELTLATDLCAAPEGAWFPLIDAAGCAIGQFSNFVWKGLQFIASGIAWVALSVGAVLFFVSVVIVNLLLGAVSIYGSLFSLGAPSPVQEIIDVMAIAAAAFLIFVVVSLLRGTEG